jgi:hypothetical protein
MLTRAHQFIVQILQNVRLRGFDWRTSKSRTTLISAKGLVRVRAYHMLLGHV